MNPRGQSCVGEPTSVAFLKQIAARSVRVRWYLALQSLGSNSAESFMGFLKHTVGISRADLTRDCLQQTRCWPGCETVESVGVLGDAGGGFSVRSSIMGWQTRGLRIAPFAALSVKNCGDITSGQTDSVVCGVA